MNCLTLCLFLCFGFLVDQGYAGAKVPKGTKCKEHDPVDVDDDWFFKFAEEGMDNPMGSKYSVKQGFSAPPPPPENMTLKHKMCMTATYKVMVHKLVLTVEFKYNRINQFKAFVRTEGTPAEDAFKLYGDFVMTKTDNKTYILFFGCNFGTDAFWQVHTPLGTELSDKSRKEIEEHLAKNDFSSDKEHVSSQDDKIWLEKAVISDCKANVGTTSALSNAGSKKNLPKPRGGFIAGGLGK